LINESNVSAVNISANWRPADFSLPADRITLATNHSLSRSSGGF
jgi:hypothetical protein